MRTGILFLVLFLLFFFFFLPFFYRFNSNQISFPKTSLDLVVNPLLELDL